MKNKEVGVLLDDYKTLNMRTNATEERASVAILFYWWGLMILFYSLFPYLYKYVYRYIGHRIKFQTARHIHFIGTLRNFILTFLPGFIYCWVATFSDCSSEGGWEGGRVGDQKPLGFQMKYSGQAREREDGLICLGTGMFAFGIRSKISSPSPV